MSQVFRVLFPGELRPSLRIVTPFQDDVPVDENLAVRFTEVNNRTAEYFCASHAQLTLRLFLPISIHWTRDTKGNRRVPVDWGMFWGQRCLDPHRVF